MKYIRKSFADKDRSIERLYSMRLRESPKRKKGQSSIELLIIMAIALTILLSIFFAGQKSVDYSSEQLKNERGVIVIEELVEAGETVHAQGKGSTTQRYVIMPESVDFINFTGTRISMKMDDGNSIERNTRFNVSGQINVYSGSQYITVKSFETYVNYSNSL